MKRFDNLYANMISDENILLAIKDVNKSHKYLKHHKPNKIVAWVEETKADRVIELRKIIEEGFVQSEPRTFRKYDKNARKWRDINEPKLYPDQYVHHILVNVIKPAIMRGMDTMCCASVEGRGIQYGAKHIKKWMLNKSDTKYCAELDIKHFYQNLSKGVVINQMKQLIKDSKVLDLCERCLIDGVKIGFYTSQWFANATLQPLDHLIREGGFGVKKYIRYMDNFTIFSNRKRSLHRVVKVIEGWLESNNLKLKDNWQVFKVGIRLPDALGYRFGRGYTLLRKLKKLRLRKSIRIFNRMLAMKNYVFNYISSIISRIGQLKHCSSTEYINRYIGFWVYLIAKKLSSKISKRKLVYII